MPHESVTRTEREMNLNWAKANPALFVQSFIDFQSETPITDWQHFVDLSRPAFIKLIAVRRKEPFNTVTDYVMADKVYLRETGYDV